MMRNTLLAAALAAALSAQAQVAAPGPSLGGTQATAKVKAKAPAARSAFKTITWDELVPKGWDPMKEFNGMDMSMMVDGDPRTAKVMKKMREVWDNAPTNDEIVGQKVRIPGFVVPLEEGKDGVKEFLLVPYFGACIHTPPPPSNQIIDVLPTAAAKGLKSMDAVWISGTITTLKTDSYMGASGYRVEASAVEPYVERPR